MIAEIGNEESYHSGAIRLLAYMSKDASPYYGKTVQQVTTGIAAAKNKLANATLTYPIVTSQGGSAFANGDMNGEFITSPSPPPSCPFLNTSSFVAVCTVRKLCPSIEQICLCSSSLGQDANRYIA